jgi:hypothetical protein
VTTDLYCVINARFVFGPTAHSQAKPATQAFNLQYFNLQFIFSSTARRFYFATKASLIEFYSDLSAERLCAGSRPESAATALFPPHPLHLLPSLSPPPAWEGGAGGERGGVPGRRPVTVPT